MQRQALNVLVISIDPVVVCAKGVLMLVPTDYRKKKPATTRRGLLLTIATKGRQ